MKILHLEDSPQDAELIHAMLLEEWPDCRIDAVATKDGFAAALTANPDVILSDFSLGTFDGLDALKIAQAQVPDIPFIFVSGSIGEDRALEAVRSGAHDYVLKDRMMRLTIAIRRALSESGESRRRREAELRLRELVEYIDKSREAIAVTDLEGRYTFWNGGAARITGWSAAEALGRTVPEVLGLPTGAGDPYGQVRDTGEWRGELAITAKDGQRVIMDVHVTLIRDDAGRPKGMLRVGLDITEKKRMEEQFLRTQRVETIGMLAAGVAHDLNNVLAPIVFGAPLLRARAAPDSPEAKLLAAMEKSAERGTALVRQITGFARGSGGERCEMQIAHLVRDLSGVILETFPKNIAFEHHFPADLWTIHAQPTQIHQVLLNLCVNARDAMPTGGKLTVRASNQTLEKGRFVVVEIVDTGTGIPPGILEKIWEPFFTTKGAAQGTGLGLATVRGIVENHQGFVDVKTAEGQGTTFVLGLPAMSGQAG